MSERHIVILGNGITGITAARMLRKRSNQRITVVSGETEHHFSRTALMYIFMGDMRYEDTKPYPDDFWAKNRIELKQGWVHSIDSQQKRLLFKNGESLKYDTLILATGSKPNRFGWPGEELEGVQGLYSYQDLEMMEQNVKRAKRAVLVGGGLIGVEVAEMLLTRKIQVTFLVREKTFWGSVLPKEESAMINREIRAHGVDLRFETGLQEILADGEGRVRGVRTLSGEEIACEMVFLTAGVSPQIEIVKVSGIECDRGILVDRFLKTSVPDIWAGGDCAQHREAPEGRRPVEQVWYTGKIQGERLAANICGDLAEYDPGIWFNSAKFFDIEYQTYGWVMPKLKEGEKSFYWEHPEGNKSVRINFEEKSGAVLGVNVFGIRHRHQVWEQWILEKKTIHEVLTHLGAANFDPEFYSQYENQIIRAFNLLYADQPVELKTPKGLFSKFFAKILK
jgi:NAD(P)H-nitrite reductase large subunit